MMGHKINTYHDIQMKGIDFLRNMYAASGLSVKPRTKVSRVEMLKEIVRAWGLDPEKVLVKETLSQPHRVPIDATSIEQDRTRALSMALKKILRKELLTNVD